MRYNYVIVLHDEWKIYFAQIFVFTYMVISQHFFPIFRKKNYFYLLILNLFYHIYKLKLIRVSSAHLILMS